MKKYQINIEYIILENICFKTNCHQKLMNSFNLALWKIKKKLLVKEIKNDKKKSFYNFSEKEWKKCLKYPFFNKMSKLFNTQSHDNMRSNSLWWGIIRRDTLVSWKYQIITIWYVAHVTHEYHDVTIIPQEYHRDTSLIHE